MVTEARRRAKPHGGAPKIRAGYRFQEYSEVTEVRESTERDDDQDRVPRALVEAFSRDHGALRFEPRKPTQWQIDRALTRGREESWRNPAGEADKPDKSEADDQSGPKRTERNGPRLVER